MKVKFVKKIDKNEKKRSLKEIESDLDNLGFKLIKIIPYKDYLKSPYYDPQAEFLGSGEIEDDDTRNVYVLKNSENGEYWSFLEEDIEEFIRNY